MEKNKRGARRRRILKVVMAAAFVAVLAFGWKYPWLAYCMFLSVAAGVVGALRRGGRYGCGNLCPRGAFYRLLPDTGRKLPHWAGRNVWLAGVVPAVMAALIAATRPGWSWREWGVVFFGMIVVTTLIGLAGYLVWNRGFWCAMCPMGKIFRRINPEKNRLTAAASCVRCGRCVKACPFQFDPGASAGKDGFTEAGCIKCGRCVEVCPVGALSFPARHSN
ncbi:MAG: 4Fe-4S binding protein [Victivallaceae bacterium]|nr:4Fe-4S binding protein [Victivallaceae bacterium]